MCTLSLVVSPDGSELRAMMNRDERRLRPVAEPPRMTAIATGALGLWPRDPQSGGTWIAATDAGLVFALMNASGEAPALPSPSRGGIIPRLAPARSLEELEASWSAMDVRDYPPFRLVVASRGSACVLAHPRLSPPLTVRLPLTPSAALVFSSSSLGDDVVETPRRELFAELLRNDADQRRAQDRFHQHAWPDRRHLSVLMTRADACTVSRTEVRLTTHGIQMRYCPIVDGWPGAVQSSTLACARPARAAA
jgi:hypothetical protein